MRLYNSKIFFYSIVLLLLSACKNYYLPTNNTANILKIEAQNFDSIIYKTYKPYKDSLDKIMNIDIAFLENDIYKKQPEGELNNLLADIILNKATQYTNQKIDFAFLNYGAIRLPSIAKGNIKLNTIYQLMPFDNTIVVLQINDSILNLLINHIVTKNGWPISNATITIKNKLLENFAINNITKEKNKIYTIATLDYVANGGDDCAFLKPIQPIPTNIIFRDAIIEYCKENKNLQPKIEGRIKNVE